MVVPCASTMPLAVESLVGRAGTVDLQTGGTGIALAQGDDTRPRIDQHCHGCSVDLRIGMEMAAAIGERDAGRGRGRKRLRCGTVTVGGIAP